MGEDRTQTIEEIMVQLGEKGHGSALSYNPMGGWDARITTFEHRCGKASDYDNWCNGQCSFVMGKKSAREALHDSCVRANIQNPTPPEARDE